MGRLERKYLAHYIGINEELGGVTYVRIGRDLESYTEELNPKVDIQRNLRGEPTVSFAGYQAESSVETYYADPSEGLFYYIQNIANKRLTDETCKTTKVDALFNANGEQIWAYREDCWVVPLSIGGDTSGVQLPFNVYCAGNRVYGTFDPVEKTFTAGGEEPPAGGSVVPITISSNGVYSAPETIAYTPVTVLVPQTINGASEFVERTLAGDISVSGASRFGDYAFAGMTQVTGVSGSCNQIGDYAFHKCGIKSASYPSCSIIGVHAFEYCTSLTYASFPSCTQIGWYAFQSCYSLSIAYFPSAQTIGEGAFFDCRKLEEASFPSVTNIGSSAFYLCSGISSAYFPSATSIGIYAFYKCSQMSSIYAPSVARIGNYAFFGCKSLTSADFPVCSSVGNYAFNGCTSLSAFSSPKCNDIGTSAFQGTPIESVYLPESSANVTIGASAFYNCSSLTAVRIDTSGNVYIMGGAFRNCFSLSDFSVSGSFVSFSSICFGYCSSLGVLRVHGSASFGYYAFSQCVNLISLYLYYSGGVAQLTNTQTFMSTPIAGYSSVAGQYGSIYVPSALLQSYKTATNWATLSSFMVGI
jgi:hypothetical protein